MHILINCYSQICCEYKLLQSTGIRLILLMSSAPSMSNFAMISLIPVFRGSTRDIRCWVCHNLQIPWRIMSVNSPRGHKMEKFGNLYCYCRYLCCINYPCNYFFYFKEVFFSSIFLSGSWIERQLWCGYIHHLWVHSGISVVLPSSPTQAQKNAGDSLDTWWVPPSPSPVTSLRWQASF